MHFLNSFVSAVGANFGLNQTDSGWMKADSFFHYVTQHLNPRWIEMKVERPIVLTVDCYSGHHSFKLFQWCQENEIILIILYPNSTHILQVCDVAMFGPMKQKYTELHQEWKIENPEKIFDQIEFVKVLKKVNDQTIKKDSIINGWRATGLQPFNFDNVKIDRLLETPISKKVTILSNELVDYQMFDGLPTISLDDPISNEFQIDSWNENSLCLPVELINEASTSYAFSNKNILYDFVDQNHEILETSINLNDNEDKIKELLKKIGGDLKDLEALLHVSDPEKLLNVLIMKQQLNIIKPPQIVILDCSLSPKTIDDILEPPHKIVRKKPKNKNMKIKYGVMSGKNVVEGMNQRINEEKQAEEVKGSADEEKLDRKKEIEVAQAKLKNDREKLKALRQENLEKNKLVRTKRERQKQFFTERGNDLTQEFASTIEDSPLHKKRRTKNNIEVKAERRF